MVMYSDVDRAPTYGQYQVLADYSPGESGGVSTVGVGLSVSLTQEGVAASASASWSYSVPDVYVNDNSNYGNNLMDLWHNVAENLPVGHGTYTIQPGNIIRVSTAGDGYYHFVDEYRITFCDDIFWGWYHTGYREYIFTVGNVIG
jgi:hypothetical protein